MGLLWDTRRTRQRQHSPFSPLNQGAQLHMPEPWNGNTVSICRHTVRRQESGAVWGQHGGSLIGWEEPSARGRGSREPVLQRGGSWAVGLPEVSVETVGGEGEDRWCWSTALRQNAVSGRKTCGAPPVVRSAIGLFFNEVAG